MSHIHILFTMLIILNIPTNRLTAETTSKTYCMLDFNEIFWHADKRGKTWKVHGKTPGKTRKIRRKLRILKFFLRTQCVADANLWMRTQIIRPPLLSTSHQSTSIEGMGNFSSHLNLSARLRGSIF